MGPAGHFLTHKHTLKHMRSSQWRPKLLNRQGRERWEADGALDLRHKARGRALDLLRGHTPEPFAADRAATVQARIDAFVAARG